MNRYLSGVYYVASQHAECSPWYILEGKLERLAKVFSKEYTAAGRALVTTGSAAALGLPAATVDYIFTDPPFGENIYYADLNYLVESWHRIWTDARPEAIIDRAKHKALPDYQRLMQRCFEEYYRVLKPGRWMTVVFHNSQSSVWRAIQEALQAAGFVVADVRTLDKQQGSYRQETSTSVKQDLVISVYKPNGGLEQRFPLEAGTDAGVWDFIRTHLRQVAVCVTRDDQVEVLAERLAYLLYDRMVAFHVQRGVYVPLSAAEFYAQLTQRFPMRDGMYFLPEQIEEYERRRLTARELRQLSFIVTDESSAINWLRQQLLTRPQTTQELTPQFMRELNAWHKHEQLIELGDLLEQNFLCYRDEREAIPAQIVAGLRKTNALRASLDVLAPEPDGSVRTANTQLLAQARDRWYVPDPSRATDLEKLRLREFALYRESKGRLKMFRTEALRAGFKQAWNDRDYLCIKQVAERLLEAVLHEDQTLLMYYDNALSRLGA